jgi:hypothetical protein
VDGDKPVWENNAMLRLRAVQIGVRTLWITGAALRAFGAGSRVLGLGVLLLLGLDVVLAHIRNPDLLRRPSRSEVVPSIMGALAMATLIAVAAIFAAILI